uniref:RRM domain-containing protein n=1 Tax=Gouania willdenowi TaxID=441366 RepID=A0A8C5N7D8_GOUWI
MLNEGVVVQVMGELSNNMQPMRRFAQTFVLAPEGTTLFVGNIPHDVEKPELMEFFEQFGSVLDFKIICREKHPNFGFVVFNDSEPVQKILSSRPIELFEDVRLNVQKKMTCSPREVECGDARPRPGAPRGGGVRGPSSQGGGTNKPSLGSVLRLRPLLKPHPLCIWTFIKILVENYLNCGVQTLLKVGFY